MLQSVATGAYVPYQVTMTFSPEGFIKYEAQVSPALQARAYCFR
jgi:hypothetical protein